MFVVAHLFYINIIVRTVERGLVFSLLPNKLLLFTVIAMRAWLAPRVDSVGVEKKPGRSLKSTRGYGALLADGRVNLRHAEKGSLYLLVFSLDF